MKKTWCWLLTRLEGLALHLPERPTRKRLIHRLAKHLRYLRWRKTEFFVPPFQKRGQARDGPPDQRDDRAIQNCLEGISWSGILHTGPSSKEIRTRSDIKRWPILGPPEPQFSCTIHNWCVRCSSMWWMRKFLSVKRRHCWLVHLQSWSQAGHVLCISSLQEDRIA